ncbi:hypothetical protein GCM10010326_28890 [Streptomyces xanthochromogenes]|uniref:Uncharacterized protein n=1 Tax=Streptomyces xanthochromogenes TaxID=67384 RepID=A0ABQ3A2J4_9ACTN|nr:hypothetical protein GCM10010326_28890 [Streptomyces xanthochromogenes]
MREEEDAAHNADPDDGAAVLTLTLLHAPQDAGRGGNGSAAAE